LVQDIVQTLWQSTHLFPIWIGAICFVGLLALTPVVLRAQAGNADVLGTVTDATGAVIPDATVTVHNLGTLADRVLTTNAKGEYLASLLQNGHYSLKIVAKGFKEYSVATFPLSTGDRLRMDAKLDPGAVTEVVTVQASDAIALQTDSSSVTSTVDEKATQDLPLNNRSFAGALALMPGVVMSSASSSQFGPSDRRASTDVIVNGQLPAYNNNMIDGFDNNERNNGLAGVRPPIDGIQEMVVDTSVFRAEIGRAGGGAINLVTKSGTTKFHGSAYEYLRNEVFDAMGFFATSKPEYRQNIFGGSVGGPAYKHKTFFFFDWEMGRLKQGQTSTLSIPTASELTTPGDFSDITVCYGSGGPPPAPGSVSPSGCRVGPNLITGVGIFDATLNGGKGGFTDTSNATPIAMPADALALWALIPKPNATGVTTYNGEGNQTPLNNYTSATPETQNSLTWSLRVDHHFSDNDQLFVRYAYNPVFTNYPGVFPAVNGISPGGNNNNFPGPSNTKSQNMQVDYVHVFNSNLTVDLKAGFSRVNLQTDPLNKGLKAADKLGIPNVYIPSIPSTDVLPIFDLGTFQLGSSNAVPVVSINNNWQYAGAVTYTHGAHTFKFGAGFIRRQLEDFTNQEGGGAFPVNGNSTPYTNFGQFLTGHSTVQLRSIDLVAPHFEVSEYSVFGQDDWRATSKLTLNMGIRYDIFPPWQEAKGYQSNFDVNSLTFILAKANPAACTSCKISPTLGVNTKYNDVSPRFGFAYSIDSKTVLRGGYGMSWYPLEIGTNSAGSSPSSAIGLPNVPYVFNYTYTPGSGTPSNPYTAPSFANGPVLPGTCTTAASCTLEQAATNVDSFKSNSNVTAINVRPSTSRAFMVQQINMQAQRQFSDYVLTVGYVGVLANGLGRGINLNAPDPPGLDKEALPYKYAAQMPYINSMGQIYNGAYGNYTSMQVILTRQFKQGLSLNANYTWAHALDDTWAGSAAIVVSNPHYDYGNSSQDIRSRVVARADYTLPFGKNAKGITRILLSGWQTNGIFSFNTGNPYGVNYTIHGPGTLKVRVPGLSSDRPDVVPGRKMTVKHPTINQWFNSSDKLETRAFAEDTNLGVAGTARKNLLYGPSFFNADMSVLKNFAITENTKIQFRAEVFNIANITNFAGPDSGMTDTNYGRISSIQGNPRQMQFALKFLF